MRKPTPALPGTPSNVDIAKRPSPRAHQLAHLPRGSGGITQLDPVFHGGVSARGFVSVGIRPGDGAVRPHSALLVLHLPDPPHSVDARVMKVEDRIAGRGVQIPPGVSS